MRLKRSLLWLALPIILGLSLALNTNLAFAERPTNPLLALYSRTKAVNYANYWAKGRNPNYKSFGVDSDGENCNDCTNYVSQVLRAGGMPQVRGSNDVFHWYHYKSNLGIWRVSKSWSATDWFNTFASQFQGSKFEYYQNGPSTLDAGDFFLMDLPTNPFVGPDHARIIVGWGKVLEGDEIGQWRLLANQHCVDRKKVRWDYNFNGTVLIWAWHVVY